MRNAYTLCCLLLLSLPLLKAQSPWEAGAEWHCQHRKALALPSIPAAPMPPDPRNDTVDILDIALHLNFTQKAQKQISGYATLTLLVKSAPVQQLRLDLEGLTVDSVIFNAIQPMPIFHDGRYLTTALPGAVAGDTVTLTIGYHGQPGQDASGWGGFYFTGDYAFNLGVGFAADPHNYGRVWFPCLDNFTQKSTYSFHITTNTGDMALCNGTLQSETDHGNGTTTWHWHLAQPIPSYLVGISVAPYRPAKWIYQGMASSYPVWLGAKAQDTTNAKASFANLNATLEAFELAYGPQPFDRVGYALVPFSSGAMEHPTNIAYPLSAAQGTLDNERLMAHELAHHWWGDWMTCASAEDMWLNEGWASWSEHLFREHVYGPEAYRNSIRTNHNYVLHRAHIDDDGFRALSGVPHAYTYGTHSYRKGADVAHTLRGYLGDSLFFHCIQDFLAAHAWDNASSANFRDHLSDCTGRDMGPFFEGWVFAPGFPHFSADSLKVSPHGNQHRVELHLRQRLYGAPAYQDSVPLEVTFFDQQWNSATRWLTMNGRCGIFSAVLDFAPTGVKIDPNERISDAVSDHSLLLTSSVTNQKTDAYMELLYAEVTGDSMLLHMEHHWVAPDPFKTPRPGLHLSDRRYWRIDGIWPAGSSVIVRFPFNGTTANDGHLDNMLISNSEDSLVLLYRPGPGYNWQDWHDYTIQPLGSKIDKRGHIDARSIVRGEYTLAIYDKARKDTIISDIPTGCVNLNTGTAYEPPQPDPVALDMLTISPNPARDTITIDVGRSDRQTTLEVIDVRGTLMYEAMVITGFEKQTIDCSTWAPGLYVVKKMVDGQLVGAGQVVIVK